MTILQSKNLSIGDIHRLFNYQRQYNESFQSLLTLEPLTDFERQEILQIRTDFDNYIIESKVLEGLVKALTVFPIMRLAGFYRSPIKIALEENIQDIVIEDEDTKVTGRLDILAVNKAKLNAVKSYFWVLIVESKNSGIDVFEGLPQLLAYAYDCLKNQESVWGLTTNGREYQFVYIQQGNPPTYQLMPSLNLIESQKAVELLQVLKAICELG